MVDERKKEPSLDDANVLIVAVETSRGRLNYRENSNGLHEAVLVYKHYGVNHTTHQYAISDSVIIYVVPFINHWGTCIARSPHNIIITNL